MSNRHFVVAMQVFAAAMLGLAANGARAQSGDDYAAMLGYLASNRVDGQAFSGANGAIAINSAAGDLNLQANLRSFASGTHANADIRVAPVQRDDHYDSPVHAAATIGGSAFNGAHGLLSINQASGSANAELNLVAVALAQQGIREAGDEALASSSAVASAGEQSSRGSRMPSNGTRSVAVESTALQGFEGVLQLNQVAGSGNVTGNQIGMSVQATP